MSSAFVLALTLMLLGALMLAFISIFDIYFSEILDLQLNGLTLGFTTSTIQTNLRIEMIANQENEGLGLSSTMTVAKENIRQGGNESDYKHDRITFPSVTVRAIAKTALSVTKVPLRLLVYNESSFSLYSLVHDSDPEVARNADCLRCHAILGVLIPAILELNISRSGSFQLLFSDADFSHSGCIRVRSCGSENFALVLHFGSVLRNQAVLPTVRAYPTPPFMNCLSEWRRNSSIQNCTAWTMSFTNKTFQELVPRITWRGANFPFLSSVSRRYYTGNFSVPRFPFNPRQRAVEMAKDAHWLDANFSKAGKGPSLTREQVSESKYQIDLGGAGGTTFTGTLEKLRMPGLLFHHETPSMDWFFPRMQAWRHYVPIRTDLSDLEEKYKWAEAHADEAERISHEATKFVDDMLSQEGMKREYNLYFQQLLFEAVSTMFETQPIDQSVLQWYGEQNLTLKSIGVCTRDYCDIFGKKPLLLTPMGATYLKRNRRRRPPPPVRR